MIMNEIMNIEHDILKKYDKILEPVNLKTNELIKNDKIFSFTELKTEIEMNEECDEELRKILNQEEPEMFKQINENLNTMENGKIILDLAGNKMMIYVKETSVGYVAEIFDMVLKMNVAEIFSVNLRNLGSLILYKVIQNIDVRNAVNKAILMDADKMNSIIERVKGLYKK